MPDVFRKTVPAGAPNPFPSESTGLKTLGATGVARVPKIIRIGSSQKHHFLELERLELVPNIPSAFGKTLRALHAHTSPHGRYGFPIDNFIGGSPQPNPWTDSWSDFFMNHRIRHQLTLAAEAGFHFAEQCALLERAGALLEGHHPPAALLHGDLWSGNAWSLAGGAPVFYDPAPYYGDPETDLAFTKLFGGFPGSFYQDYPAQHPQLHALYNLYHLLNHLVLFGRSYLPEVRAHMKRIIAG